METNWPYIFKKVQTGTQAELAERLEISQGYLSRLQRGKRKPGLKLRRKLAGMDGEALAVFLGEIAPILPQDLSGRKEDDAEI